MYKIIRLALGVALSVLWGLQPAISYEGEENEKKSEHKQKEHQEEHGHKAPPWWDGRYGRRISL